MIGLLLLGVAAFGLLGIIVIGQANKGQKTAESQSEQILDATFDGRPDVTFTVNMRTLKYETVVLGAKQRGYKLVHQADNNYGPHTLIFEKIDG